MDENTPKYKGDTAKLRDKKTQKATEAGALKRLKSQTLTVTSSASRVGGNEDDDSSRLTTGDMGESEC